MYIIRYTVLIFLLACLLSNAMQCQENPAKYVKGQVIIKFTVAADSLRIDSLCREMNIEKIKEIPRIRAYVCRIRSKKTPEELIKKYKDNIFIEYIEPNYQNDIN